jgi:cbb3-type cytochrome oxidase subunit 3
METLWAVINIAAPALLILAIIWVFLRNRKRPRAEFERAERGAAELRQEIERDEARDGQV